MPPIMDDNLSKHSSVSKSDVDITKINGLISPTDVPREKETAVNVEEEAYSIYSKNAKRFIIFMVSVSALISPLAATLYLPALNPLAKQLNVSNSLINLTITSYMVSDLPQPTAHV
jgi:hypothetical protein